MSTSSATSHIQAADCPRFQEAQLNRSLQHPTLPQCVNESSSSSASAQPGTDAHCFVIAADTQFGMTEENRSWDVEVEYSRKAVAAINSLQPRPLFCCLCGDLVDMTASIFAGKPKSGDPKSVWTEEECDRLQDRQNQDFKKIWSDLHPEIALVCLCGNHDVGNRPTAATIEKFTTAFGDDYLAFWANGTYNIVVNSALFSDPSAALDLYRTQLAWLEQRLEYGVRHAARNIFVYSHHPWFLYSEDEEPWDLHGTSHIPGWMQSIQDAYFHIPKQYRRIALDMFRKYGVSAAFSGHFHQNLVSRTSFGMEMIVTGSLSVVLDSTGNTNGLQEPKTQGIRIVQVEHDPSGGPGKFHHRFVGLSSNNEATPVLYNGVQ